ncbi:hypothetical protein BGZ61DRAFT_452302 [Ilyonectria robusta]|uniref:uncharacterized protein n=1 Tax=Ilyonectria robusta TaxID=1079257 RepID=UPI001E8EC65B|nr:uncharacterized protein BGZ61DRAFT_452302 [Ilyonectria robusta]KAH8694672.1 hypothetical protein BGZ61DRAFT_452302 [Ilyonectria robusta]
MQQVYCRRCIYARPRLKEFDSVTVASLWCEKPVFINADVVECVDRSHDSKSGNKFERKWKVQQLARVVVICRREDRLPSHRSPRRSAVGAPSGITS